MKHLFLNVRHHHFRAIHKLFILGLSQYNVPLRHKTQEQYRATGEVLSVSFQSKSIKRYRHSTDFNLEDALVPGKPTNHSIIDFVVT